jgi:hypothetical protein
MASLSAALLVHSSWRLNKAAAAATTPSTSARALSLFRSEFPCYGSTHTDRCRTSRPVWRSRPTSQASAPSSSPSSGCIFGALVPANGTGHGRHGRDPTACPVRSDDRTARTRHHHQPPSAPNPSAAPCAWPHTCQNFTPSRLPDDPIRTTGLTPNESRKAPDSGGYFSTGGLSGPVR